MPRLKGSKNKNSTLPNAFSLKNDERIQLLANLIVDRIMANQNKEKEPADV